MSGPASVLDAPVFEPFDMNKWVYIEPKPCMVEPCEVEPFDMSKLEYIELKPYDMDDDGAIYFEPPDTDSQEHLDE